MSDTGYKIRDWFARNYGKGWRAKYDQWKLEHKSGELPWQSEKPSVEKAASKINRIREKGVPSQERAKREQDLAKAKQQKEEKQ